MTRAELKPVTAHEARAIAEIVRPEDIAELVEALGLKSIVVAIESSIVLSDKAQKIVCGDEVLAVFGDAKHGTAIGVPWLISTVHVDKHVREFLRVTREAVDEMLTRHEELMNFVDVRNERAIRWLKRLGFEFHDAMPYGPNQMPFYPFTKRRSA